MRRAEDVRREKNRSAVASGTGRRTSCWLRRVGLLGLLVATGGSSSASSAPRVLNMQQAVQQAQEANPGILTLAADVDAARARTEGASVLLRDNPTVTGAVGPRSSISGRSLDYGVQITQPVEIAGQRGARIDATEAALAATEAQLQTLRAEVTAKVRIFFGRALAARQRLKLAEEAVTLAQQGASAAEERFQAGAAAMLEVNTAKVEQGRATRQRAQAEKVQALALADLRLAIGLGAMEELELQDELPRADVQQLAPSTELVKQALANRRELQQAKRAVEAATAEARLAARDWIPTPRLGFSYNHEQESRATILQGVLAFDLPLFNRNVGPRGVTKARVRQLTVELEAQERLIAQEVITAIARFEAARAAANGYAGDVVRAMQENMELVTASYRAGKIDFLELVVIRRQSIEASSEYIDVLEELNAASAQLNQAVGGPLAMVSP